MRHSIFYCCLAVLFLASAVPGYANPLQTGESAKQAASADWLESGWNQFENSQYQEAIATWQAGVNSLPDKQLLGSLGIFSNWDNALALLKLAGPQEKAFIIFGQQKTVLYYVMTAQEMPEDLQLRQTQLTSIKSKIGLQEKIIVSEAYKFKTKAPESPAKAENTTGTNAVAQAAQNPALASAQEEAAAFQSAVMDYQFQDFKEAEDKFRKIVEKNPDNIAARYYMGMVLQQNKKLEEAVSHLEFVMEKSKTTPVAGIEDALSAAYTAAGMHEKALPFYKKKYEESKDNDALAFAYAKALESAGDIQTARTMYQNLIEKKGPYADAGRFQMAQIILGNKAYATAIEQLNEIDEQSPYGPAAKSYKEALAPAVKPFNLYVSSEWFNNDNASSGGSSRINQASSKVGSHGLTQIVSLNSRGYEWTERLKAKLGYLYYGMFHYNMDAKSNDFVGHFVNPSQAYQITESINTELKGDIQYFYYAHQRLSINLGGTSTTTWTGAGGDNIALHGNFISKKYTTQFLSSGPTTPGTYSSLKYLDARSAGIGIAGTLMDKSQKGSLTVDYTFNMDRPIHTRSSDITLAAQSADSKYNEHSLRINGTLPLTKWSQSASLLGNTSYSYKYYLNPQDPNARVYANLQGQHVKATMLVYGLKLQFSDIYKIGGYGINANLGYEQTIANSSASALTYKSLKSTASIYMMF